MIGIRIKYSVKGICKFAQAAEETLINHKNYAIHGIKSVR